MKRITVRSTRAWAALACILCLGAALRLPAISAWPAGLHPDEAAEGLAALRILDGARPIYLPENRGREPLFAYLVAGSVGILGRTPGAIRIVGVAADLAAAAGVYLAASTLLSRRIGLASALLYAVTVWPILAGRFGTRVPLLPPLLAFGLWQGALAWRTGRMRHWLAAGALLGIAFYSYTPIRMFPLVLAFGGLLAAWRRQLRRLWPGAAAGLGLAGLFALPLAMYSIAHFDAVFGRSAQVSILGQGPAPNVAASQAYLALRMFLFSGDWNPRQDIGYPGTLLPPRPVFDWAAGAAFVLGHLAALRHWRRPLYWLAYCWLGVMLLPTILSDEAPHFGRAAGLLPILFVWPALGLTVLRDRLRGWAGAWPALFGPSLLLGLATLFTFRDLWLDRYLGQPWLSSVYYGGQTTEVAVQANKFLGEGWTGSNLAALPTTDRPQRQVAVEESLARSPAFEYLVGASRPAVRILEAGELPRAPAGQETLLILPAEGGLGTSVTPPAGMVVQVCQGGFNWLPPDNQRGAPLFVLVAVVRAESQGPCA